MWEETCFEQCWFSKFGLGWSKWVTKGAKFRVLSAPDGLASTVFAGRVLLRGRLHFILAWALRFWCWQRKKSFILSLDTFPEYLALCARFGIHERTQKAEIPCSSGAYILAGERKIINCKLYIMLVCAMFYGKKNINSRIKVVTHTWKCSCFKGSLRPVLRWSSQSLHKSIRNGFLKPCMLWEKKKCSETTSSLRNVFQEPLKLSATGSAGKKGAIISIYCIFKTQYTKSFCSFNTYHWGGYRAYLPVTQMFRLFGS